MKKQIDFDVRVWTMNPGGINGAYRHEALVNMIHQLYPTELGWELQSVENIQLSADGVSVLFFLVRYDYSDVNLENMPPEVAAETVKVKRGPGRPKKEVPLPEGITEGV